VSETPAGWQRTNMGSIGKYLNGRAFKESDWSDRGRPIIRIQNLTGSNSRFNYYDGDIDERYVVRGGDLLFSWAATLGTYFWHGEEAVLNQHIFRIESNINPKFHKYLLDYKIQELYAQSHGSGMVHITKSKFDALPVDVPPLDVQQRIVETLEDHLSRLDRALDEIEKANAQLQTLRYSLLEEIVHSQAPMCPLSSLTRSSQYGTSVKCAVGGKGVAVARIPNLKGGAIDMSDEKRASSDSDLSSLMLEAGDLLFVRTNGSADLIGRTAVVQPGVRAAFASYLIRFQLDESLIRPMWVHYLMESLTYRDVLQRLAASSAGQFNLGLKKLESIEIPVPALDVQDRLIHELLAGTESIRELTVRVEAIRATATQLRRSLLHTAFTGQLLNEEPND